MRPSIVFTGGGTAGHVTPNIALIEACQKDGWKIDYIGSKEGIEKAMIQSQGIAYYGVHSGKLRRYLSWKTLLDPFKLVMGIGQAYFILRKLKPDVVFSKGGFVAFPVVVAAWLNRVPVIAHESDMSPGLANRLSYPFVSKICINFDRAKQHFKSNHKIEVTGTPIRTQLFMGNKEKGLALCGFNATKPCLLVMGGSQGAETLNQSIRQGLTTLCERFQIIHLCGKGKTSESLRHQEGYYQFEYAKEELADLLAASDMVVSRAGANSLCELLALCKPHVLVPLSERVSRGDQVQNARYFHQQGISVVIPEETLTPARVLEAIDEACANQSNAVAKMKQLGIRSATEAIMAIIKEHIHASN